MAHGLSKRLVVLAVLLVVGGVAAGAYYWLAVRADQPGQVARSQNEAVTFAAVGDFGANDNTRSVLRAIKNQNTDFSLALGDLSYGKVTEAAWCDMVQDVLGETYPFQLIPGNHDAKEPEESEGDLQKFLACLPNRIEGLRGVYGSRYSFDLRDMVRVVAVSPNINGMEDYSPGSDAYVWMMKEIDAARTAGIPWVVVAMHENCISAGQKQCEIGSGLFNDLIDKKVDVILQGHEHAYMRSQQFTHTTACPRVEALSYNQSCVQTASNATYRQGNGSVLIINGTGGIEQRDIDFSRPDSQYFASMHGKNQNPVYGPSILRATNDSLQVSFVDEAGIRHDSFTIVR